MHLKALRATFAAGLFAVANAAQAASPPVQPNDGPGAWATAR